MSVTTVNDSLTALSSRWPATHGQSFVLQYDLSQPLDGDGSKVYITFVAGVATASLGQAVNPESTIQMSAPNYIRMLNDDFDTEKAFMNGSFKVLGNALFVRNLRKSIH